ncbi:MAG: hypothetical protein V4640_02535 [Verrucomicrobiota bacterium]
MKSNLQKWLLPVLLLFILTNVLAWKFAGKQSAVRGTNDTSPPSSRSRSSERSDEDPERARQRQESIALAAQKWYEELLEKYPRMKPDFRDVPDEQNGYLQFLIFADSLKEPLLTDDLKAMLKGDSAWDKQKFKAWLAENPDVFDRILHIAELPDQSAKGVALNRLAFGPARFGGEFSLILRSAARSAFEDGDAAAALRYMKASSALADHLVEIEVPTMLGEVVGVGMRQGNLDSFHEHFLPQLATNPEALKAWQEALFHQESPADEYSRVILGEWNTMVRHSLLPALLGSESAIDGRLPIQDVEGFLDASVAAFLKSADGVSQLGEGRFDAAGAALEMDCSGLDPVTASVFKDVMGGLEKIPEALGIQVTRRTLHAAAISILLGETPPIDPVSGKAFSWDPKTRLLSGPEENSAVDPIKVP